MATKGFFLFNCLLLFLLLNMSTLYGATEEDRKVCIVYLGSLPQGEYSLSSLHRSMLQEVVDDGSVENKLVRSYKRSFNGFAAKLTDKEMQKLATKKGVVSVFPSRTLQLQTTNSWDFIGLKESVKRNPSVESDVIVGVLDSGIWPESESFSDEGFGPAPKKWKGACTGRNFTCNKKLIGARYYSAIYGEDETARDTEGHGTHTASTAAGNKVKDANFFGLGQGTARGGVPSSRIAVYKVCREGCREVDILSAFDDAIADGVDLITISIGGDTKDFSEDAIAIGSFHAMAKGILTLNSAGNSGPFPGTTGSVSPWMMSVAATTTDRLFVDRIVLGNGTDVTGFSINGFSQNGKKFPLVIGRQVPGDCAKPGLTCSDTCLDSSSVEGKIVLCEVSEGSIVAHQAGAAGSITLKNNIFGPVSFVVSSPSSSVTSEDYNRIISYIDSKENCQAEILKTESIKDSDAPVVAFFSSRGPNIILPEILKPDISAPGVDILAAFSPVAPLTEDEEDKRQAKFNIVSGTSMACPHVAGVAAYVKTFHPTWSPSAIKSAIMTTARPMNDSITSQAEFAYGSGFVNPINALDPGLVYEAFEEDYIRMLCSIGYSSEKLRRVTGDNNTCPEASEEASPKDLNYPSMASKVSAGKSFTTNFHRTVTNVGLPNSTYKVHVFSNSGVTIKVVPEVLSFKRLNEKKSFNVTVSGKGVPVNTILSASIVWSDGKHNVRSPIALIAKRDSIKN
ncbi:subtilisin-like protease SBT4.3 [Mangifera indica]|uniref:subtilisin-like protease SBT4.3 n=1 Tax=Mangifera indica TaxID=29780 RepID=UPI001CF9304D|nr:subtilisin-like protease SBT4.3 [Mangifera indica]